MAEAASSASAAVTSVRPLQFGASATDVSFPWGGALLLLILLAVAAWSWLLAARRGIDMRPAWLSRVCEKLAPPSPDGSSPQLRSTTRLDAATLLHVVEWQGRSLLIGVNGSAPPVLLAEHRGPNPS